MAKRKKLNDINKNNNNDKFYNLALTQINFRPLIYQGLINGKPDIDSIFLLNKIKHLILFLMNNILYYIFRKIMFL